ncbi:hypothetical protein [Wenyingzhuangia sp. 2_MG-2023]|nr:hypothetical protein [Wenyingzhuangia sp. 2_MG-2023]MDO6738190.1 hypothetical protein [Wenyingzhuangia sp. 2_MG-2023]
MSLLTDQTEYFAGQNIVLQFKNMPKPETALYCNNSYTNTLVYPTTKNNITSYTFPDFIIQKSGSVHWQLTQQLSNTKGAILIQPNPQTSAIETYLGPPSIQVGNEEVAMLVTIPTDSLNNPVAKNTPILIHKKHNNQNTTTKLLFDGMFAYQYITGGIKTGRALISSECMTLNSKEYSLEIVPAAPDNFTISASRIHNYGDGNQITNFKTAVIQDLYQNTIADGTLVKFNILNRSGSLLQTQGTTINGVATAQMIHPDHSDVWKVHAFVDGFSESDVIELTFLSAVKDYNIRFSKKEKSIVVGPFQSFMNQILPDGLIVKLELYQKNNPLKIHQKTTQTENGFAVFDVSTLLEPNTSYSVTVQAAEIDKTLQINNK